MLVLSPVKLKMIRKTAKASFLAYGPSIIATVATPKFLPRKNNRNNTNQMEIHSARIKTLCLTCHVTCRCCDVIVLDPILVVDKLFPWKIYSD